MLFRRFPPNHVVFLDYADWIFFFASALLSPVGASNLFFRLGGIADIPMTFFGLARCSPRR